MEKTEIKITHNRFFRFGYYVAFGDLAKKEKQPAIANDYYQKALAIYLKKFDEKHIKVIMTKKKLNLNFSPYLSKKT